MENLISKIDFLNIESIIDCVPLIENYSSNDWINYLPSNFKTDQNTIILPHDHIMNNSTFSYKKILVGKTKFSEIYIIIWFPNSYAEKHSHPSQGCIYKILYGSLLETRFFNTGDIVQNSLDLNTTTFIHNDFAQHSITNLSNLTVSLHVYSPY